MANNRMWLIHRPTKLGIMLGKRLGFGWYKPPETKELERFYEYLGKNIDSEQNQDDFVLAMEDCSNSLCFDNWDYTNTFIDGFRLFKFKNQDTKLQLLIKQERPDCQSYKM